MRGKSVTLRERFGTMPFTLTPIKASGKSRMALEDISPDVVQAVEEAYTYCLENANRLELIFPTQEEAEAFLHEARSYAYQRTADGKPARVVVSGNSTQKGAVRFRVEEYVAPVPTEATNGDTPPATSDA